MPRWRHDRGDRLRPRRWSFADCVFDESNWTLTVAGQRVAIESKPLELLRELLLRAEKVVTKDELLDIIWPEVTVVEASLPTAVHKLRVVLADDRRERRIIETVPGIGYRLAVPAQTEDASTPPRRPLEGAGRVGPRIPRFGRSRAAATALTVAASAVLLLITFELGSSQRAAASKSAGPFTQRDAANALRKLDVGTIENMLAAGWDPNIPFDKEGNAAINFVLGMCEWDRGHNQEQMVLMVRTLIDGGAKLDHRNVWGDTPYSIAKAIRYCGPNHPVTRSIRTMCFAGYRPYGDRCLASYELARRDKKTRRG